MKILYVTNMYPSVDDSTYGIFVKEQIEAIERVQVIDKSIYVINGRKGFKEYLKSVFIIRKIIRKEHFDLVHIHYGLSGLFLLLGRIKAPVIMTLHGGDIQTEQGKMVQVALTKLILRKCDFAITLNGRMDEIARRYVSRTEIIPCSVNNKLFVPKERFERKPKTAKVLFPSARTRLVKDFPLFQRACKVLRDKYGLSIEEYYLENLSRQEVANLFCKMDLLLMTSISEGSPQVVKEAMACNLPIVSTNVGDVSILLDGVQNCYVAGSRDENELADLAYKSLSISEVTGISPREKISELGLDDDSIAKRIIRVYHNLV
jgi:glycosyltransferase involved in cell wall biosynthesis